MHGVSSRPTLMQPRSTTGPHLPSLLTGRMPTTRARDNRHQTEPRSLRSWPSFTLTWHLLTDCFSFFHICCLYARVFSSFNNSAYLRAFHVGKSLLEITLKICGLDLFVYEFASSHSLIHSHSLINLFNLIKII